MTISEMLSESTIKLDLDATNKTGAIEELIDLLVQQHEISMSSRADVIETVLERERVVSTGMEHGVAIPHGAVGSVDDIVAALGVSKHGVEFQAIDGKPTYIVVLLILPAEKYSSSVQTMAGISRLLNQKSLRDRLKQATTPAEVMDLIIEEEEQQYLSA